MQEDEIETLKSHPFERPVDASLDHRAGILLFPIAAADAAALGGYYKLAAAVSEIAADQLFAPGVAVGGVDEGDAEIEEAVEQVFNLIEGDAVADASRAKPMAADFQIGGAELREFFHLKAPLLSNTSRHSQSWAQSD